MGVAVVSLESPVTTAFYLWQGHPQEPHWRNESVIRLGGSEASTQLTRKSSENQISTAWIYFNTIGECQSHYRSVLNFPARGRYKWVGDSGQEVDGLIFNGIQYEIFKGSYSIAGDCYSYAVKYTLSYIVDEEEQP